MGVELGQMHTCVNGANSALSPCVSVSVHTAPSGVCAGFLMCGWTWDALLLLVSEPLM